MKNKELKKISKDLWYRLIDLDESYFETHSIGPGNDGYYHRDHVLHQSHMKNFSDPSDPLFNIITYSVNNRVRKKSAQFKSTEKFGYLPNLNRYSIKEGFIGKKYSFEEVETDIIGKLEGRISKGITAQNLSLNDIEMFLEMMAIQNTFRNVKCNIYAEKTVDDIYNMHHIGEFGLELINLALQSKRENTDLAEVFFQTDDQILEVCDISTNKNYFKVFFLYQNYLNFKKLNTCGYRYGHIIDVKDNLLITSDAYGIIDNFIIYIPISPSKLVVLSRQPFATSKFEPEPDLIATINRKLIDDMSLFAVWGAHYNPPGV